MPRGSRTRDVATLLGVALLPAVVLACVVLVQGARLSTPSAAAVVGKRPAEVSVAAWTEVRQHADHQLAKVTSDQNDALTYGWVGVALAAVLGGGLAIAASRYLARNRAASSDGASPRLETDQVESPRVRTANPNADRDRSILVDVCIDVSDTVPTVSHREQLLDALERAGVKAVDVPHGEPFDPKRHRAAGRVPTTEPARASTVAETERLGFVDRGRRLRPPHVLVYELARERTI
jgi:molecular chaperone GrpE